MKLVIQFPCVKKCSILPETLRAFLRKIACAAELGYFVIDDGSRDEPDTMGWEV